MKWKDNELRMQVDLVVTHTDDDLLFMKSEKYANTLDALQAFADLVRQDEREAIAKMFDALAEKATSSKDLIYLNHTAAAIRARGNHEQT